MSATRQSWTNLQPMPASRSLLAFQRAFSEQEVDQIRQGLIPERMEDKWFIFCEEDTLYIHRSWTGFCIFQLHLKREDAGYTAGEVFVNRDQNQYGGTDDSYDEWLLAFLINSLLLKQQVPLPIPSNVPAGIAQELHFAHVLGAGQRADQGTKYITIRGMLGWLWSWLIWLIKR